MLRKFMEMFKKNNKGFTLVELMVVVVIIGVLTAIAVPVYNNSTEKAKLTACQANQKMILSAISQYQINEGKDPANLTDLTEYFQGGKTPECPDGTDLADGTEHYTFSIDDGEITLKCSTNDEHSLYPSTTEGEG